MDGVRDRDPQEAATYRFGGFALDPARGILRRPDGAEVGLRPKSAEVLRTSRNPGRVVSRDELMEAVWPGVIVTDDSITQCVAEIRRVLGDEGAPLLRTLPRRGYLLAAEVARGEPLSLPAAAFLAATGGRVAGSGAQPRRGTTAAAPPRRASLVAGAAVAAAAAWRASPGGGGCPRRRRALPPRSPPRPPLHPPLRSPKQR